MESLAARVALKNRPGIALNLKVIGIVDANTGHAARAVLLFGGAASIEERTGEVWNEHWRPAFQRAVDAARDSLGLGVHSRHRGRSAAWVERTRPRG